MIKRLRQNRSLRASNRQKFKGDNRGNIYSEIDGQNRAIFKEFPESQVKAVIRQIRINAKAEKRKELISLILVGLIVTIILIYPLITSNSSSKNQQSKTQDLEYKRLEPIVWNGKLSAPIKIPTSNFFYIPIVGNLDYVDLNRTYQMSPTNMVVPYTSNILFLNKDSVEIGKLLAKNGSIKYMRVASGPKELVPKKIVYFLAEQDSNNNGEVDYVDKHFLYISDLNGKDLTKITERRIDNYQWVSQGNEILIQFYNTKEMNDSIYGLFNTETKELKFTNHPKEKY